jgi:hypothetical protein
MAQQSINLPVGGSPSAASPSPLSSLIGGHPAALRQIYAGGKPTDPSELGDAPRGRVLALEPASGLFLLLRPLVRALATDALPWRGKVFDHGGNSGQNVVFGRRVLRFSADVGASIVDGEPTLVLSYDRPAFGNPWPVRAVVDELRTVAGGAAMGPVYVALGHRKHVLAWWGLEQG